MDYAYSFFPQSNEKSLNQNSFYYNQDRSGSHILDVEDVLYPSTFTSPLLDTMLPSPDSIYLSHMEPLNQEYNLFYTQDTPLVHLERRSSISSTLSSLSSTKSSLYHCEFKGCKKTFTRTYNLKSHHRTHTDEKPFVCQLCSKAFARQHDRNRHEKLHSGIKPYPCHFCHKSFARQDALNRHLKRDKKKEKSLDLFMTPPPCLLLKFKKKQLAKKKKMNQKI